MARLPGDVLRDLHLGLGALPPADKAEVAEVLMDDLAAMGRVNDRDLAHITPAEAMMLKEAGGAGTLNPETGMPEYYGPGAVGVGPGSGSSSGGSGAGGFGFGPAAAAVATAMGQAASSTSSGLGSSGGMFGGYTYGGPPGSSLSPGTSPTSADGGGDAPGQMLGITPAEVTSILSNLSQDSGDAGTAEGFQFADTRGDTKGEVPGDTPPVFDFDKDIALFDFDRDINVDLAKLDKSDQNWELRMKDPYLNENVDMLESHFNRRKALQKQQMQLDRMKELSNFDLTKNIDNPFLPVDIDAETDRTVMKTKDGKPILTRDGNFIDVPNLSLMNHINSYIYDAAKDNPTMYGLETYYEPLPDAWRQLGNEAPLDTSFDLLGERVDPIKNVTEGLKSNWLNRGYEGVKNFVSDQIGFDGGDAPLMSFLTRSPLGVIKSFIADMMSKQTKALQDSTSMYMAAKTYTDKGLPIPEVSELASHDFSQQPYQGDPAFTDQWQNVPTLEQVQYQYELERLERERREREYQELLDAEYLKEYRKYFEEVPDDYYGSLREQETYTPIGLEKLLAATS